MKKIILEFTENELDEILINAEDKNLELEEFMKMKIFAKYLNPDLSLDDVFLKVSNLKKGEEFTIKGLFSETAWNNFSVESRRSICRDFKNALENDKNNLKRRVEFVSTKDKVYRKLTNSAN